MTCFELIVAGLACYRATVLIVRDDGPYDVFKRLRAVTRFTKLLTCPYCVSMWVAMFIVAGFYLCGMRETPIMYFLQVLALSAIAIVLDRTFSIS